jgi:hypothetical protein
MFDREQREPIPVCLDQMAPGPALGGFLASIDVDRVSGYDRVIVLRAQQRMASYFQAQVYAAMASVADHMDHTEFTDDADLAWEAAATEIRAALRLTRRAAESELDLAIGLRRRLPRVWEALAEGSIDGRRARVIAHGVSHFDEAAARRVVDAVIGDAPRLTTGELAARLRRLCIAVDPDEAEERYREAVEGRRVVVEASPEGTAHLMGLDLPPDRVARIARRIDRLAKSLNRSGDPRSIDQIRADVLVDLLSGRHQDAQGGMVDLRVDLETLAGLSEAPGDLAGFGPVIADIARQVAESQTRAQWRYTVVDPDTGLPIADGTTRRRPTASQQRTVEAREHTCYFPGCRSSPVEDGGGAERSEAEGVADPTGATNADLDHRTPWAEQHRTSVDGLDAGCRHDHVTVRHRLGWRHQLLPGGDHLWTSPLGHQYTRSGKPP